MKYYGSKSLGNRENIIVEDSARAGNSFTSEAFISARELNRKVEERTEFYVITVIDPA